MAKLFLLTVLSLLAARAVAQEVNFVQVTDGPGDRRYPAWSPKEGYLAFESSEGGNWNLYLLKLEDRTISRLTQDPADDRYPAWDPDGLRILFVSNRTGSPALHTLDLESRKTSLLFDAEGEETFPDWSPNGSKIAFSLAADSVSQIVVLGSSGSSSLVAKSAFDSVWPRWSPDNDRLTFFSRRDTGGEDDEIYVLNQADTTLHRLTFRPGHDFCPTWSPSGDRIAAIAVEPDGSHTMRVIPVDGGPHSVLQTSFYRITEPDWSPDGRFIAVAARKTRDDPYQIFVVSMAQ